MVQFNQLLEDIAQKSGLSKQFITNLSNRLKENEEECTVCYEVIKEKVMVAPCKHHVCFACAVQISESHSNNFICPLCRLECSFGKLETIFIQNGIEETEQEV